MITRINTHLLKTQAHSPNIGICIGRYLCPQTYVYRHIFAHNQFHGPDYTCTMCICARVSHVCRHVHSHICMCIHAHVCRKTHYSYIIRWVHIFMSALHVIAWLNHNLSTCPFWSLRMFIIFFHSRKFLLHTSSSLSLV